MIKKDVPDIIKYTHGILDEIPLHTYKTKEQALAFFATNKEIFIYNILSCFEGLQLSLRDIDTICNGFTVSTLSLNDILLVRYFITAYNQLCYNIQNNIFSPDRYELNELHKIIASYYAENDNSFRKVNVRFKNVNWSPPVHEDIPLYWHYIHEKIYDKKRIYENTLIVFLQLSRIQFYSDANKRTAILFVNGILLKNNLPPFIIPISEKRTFSNLLLQFYEDGKADDLLKFFASTSVILHENITRWQDICSQTNIHHLPLNKRRHLMWE